MITLCVTVISSDGQCICRFVSEFMRLSSWDVYDGNCFRVGSTCYLLLVFLPLNWSSACSRCLISVYGKNE